MSLINDIKDQVALDNGYFSWKAANVNEAMINQVAKDYAAIVAKRGILSSIKTGVTPTPDDVYQNILKQIT